MKCADCKFFVRVSKTLIEREIFSADEGKCHRHAKTVFHLASGNSVEGWPTVRETEFCGEFQKKGIA